MNGLKPPWNALAVTSELGKLASWGIALHNCSRIRLHRRVARLDRTVIKSSGRVMFLDAADIDWIEAAGVHVVHLGPKSICIARHWDSSNSV